MIYNESKESKNSGFTILEVMIAIMILSIGLIGAAAMQITAVNTNAKAAHMTEATTGALDLIENIMSWDATDARLDDITAVGAGAGIGYQRIGVDVGSGDTTIGIVDDFADGTVTFEDYVIFYDGTPHMDPGNPTLQVGIDMRVYVVWNEGSRLKTVEMNFTKVL